MGNMPNYALNWSREKAPRRLSGVEQITRRKLNQCDNFEKDSSARQRQEELGGRGVPLIIIGANRMSGFSEETLEYYLNNSK